MKSLLAKEASEAGVKLVVAYIAPSEHTLFFILEADKLAAVEQFTYKRLALVGNVKITPLMTVEETLGHAPKILKT